MIPRRLVPIATLANANETATSSALPQSISGKIAMKPQLHRFSLLKKNRCFGIFPMIRLNFLNGLTSTGVSNAEKLFRGRQTTTGTCPLPHTHTQCRWKQGSPAAAAAAPGSLLDVQVLVAPPGLLSQRLRVQPRALFLPALQVTWMHAEA